MMVMILFTKFMNTNIKVMHMLERKVEAVFHKVDQKIEIDSMKKTQETWSINPKRTKI